MGGQLFRRFAMETLAEPVEQTAFIDILNLLERYRYLPSATPWLETRRMRNQITHDSAQSPAELTVALDAAFGMVGEMAEIVGAIRRRIGE